MLVEGYVLVHPEGMDGKSGDHHIVAGSYETEEQCLARLDRQCIGCRLTRLDDLHIPPYQFIGYDKEQIRARLERLRQSGATVCAGCDARVREMAESPA